MKSRNRLWLIPLGLAVSFPFWQPLFASFLAIHIAERPPAENRDQRLQMEDVILNQYNQGRLELVLKAAGVQNSEFETEEYHLQQVDCLLMDDKGESTTIRGGEALFSVRHNVVTIVDDVQVETQGGKYRLTTDAMRYLTAYQVLKTATPVHLTSEEAEVHGGSMMYNLRSGDFRVGKRVVCRL